MPRNNIRRSCVAAAFPLIMACGARAEDQGASFIKDNDCWAFHGDSITHANVYTRLLERVFRHFHPDTKATFTNKAVWGKKLDELKSTDLKISNPTVVSILLGGSDVINSGWLKGQPTGGVIEGYRKKMTDLVRELKANGTTVLLMTPLLMDETCRRTAFQVEGSCPVLKALSPVIREIAAAEGVYWIPMQEDFEAFQDTLPLREQILRNDGVHPTALGQYHMARMLWERLNVAGTLVGKGRELTEPPPPLPITARLASPFMAPGATSLDIVLETDSPMEVSANWSVCGDWRGGDSVAITGRGTETLKLTGRDTWTLKIPSGLLPQKNGDVGNIVFDLAQGSRRAVFVLDLAQTRVWHFKDDLVKGAIESEKERPEGKLVCSWQFRRMDKALMFEADVVDPQIQSAPGGVWPWSGDALSLYLDLRPAERFAGIGAESDTHLLWFLPREKPFWGVAMRPWLGRNLDNASTHAGEKTPNGYRVRLLIDGYTDIHHQFDLGKLDYVGFHMSVVDFDPGAKQAVIHESQRSPFQPDMFPNTHMILDLKDKLQGDSVINTSLFPPPGTYHR